MSAISLEDALEASDGLAAQRAAAMLRVGTARASTSVAKYADLVETLRVRLKIKRDQAAAGNQNIIELRDALAKVVAWWDAHPDQSLLYESISTDSEVAFLFWRNAETGVLLAGFETRDARKLTIEGGKEFWGPDWHHPSTDI